MSPSVRQWICGKIQWAARVAGTDGAPARNRRQEDYRTLDVRRWAREGIPGPGYRGSWQWGCDGELVAWIQVQVEHERVILIYRHRSGGIGKDEQWNAMQFGRLASRVHLSGRRLRSAGSDPLRRPHLRLSALPSARLRQFTRGCR